MIRSEAEYQEAPRWLQQDKIVAARQREALVRSGLTSEDVELAKQPLLSFHAQLAEEVAWYEAVRRRTFPAIHRLTEIGRLLSALRIANGLTQRELADRLGASEAVVSRDERNERNEHHGITVERAQRVLDALNEGVTMSVDEPPSAEEERVLARAG